MGAACFVGRRPHRHPEAGRLLDQWTRRSGPTTTRGSGWGPVPGGCIMISTPRRRDGGGWGDRPQTPRTLCRWILTSERTEAETSVIHDDGDLSSATGVRACVGVPGL